MPTPQECDLLLVKVKKKTVFLEEKEHKGFCFEVKLNKKINVLLIIIIIL